MLVLRDFCIRTHGSSCTRCAQACAHNALSFAENQPPVINSNACTLCGACQGTCDAFSPTTNTLAELHAQARKAALGNRPCIITCTAESGEARKYYIWFAASTINTAATPTANDVLIKHIAGTDQLIFATLRKNVFVAVYSQRGELVFYAPVPESDQNDANVVISAEGTEKLIDVANPKVTCTLPNNQYTYIYTFLENFPTYR